MRLLIAAAVAAAFPGAALAAGLVQQRELSPGSAGRVVAAGRFELVGAHWRGPGSVRFRTRNLAGRWTAWRTFAPEDSLPDRGRETRATRAWRVASPFWVGAADALQYRPAGRVTRLRIYFVRSPRLPGRVKRAEIAGAPPVVTRAGWHADESIRRGAPFYADGIHLAIVHHTAGSNSYTRAQSASIVRGIELYHVQGNGWNDIGYNFLVDKYGQVFEGRYGGMTRPVVGAHAQGFNSGSFGVAVIGEYGSTAITPAARKALTDLIAWRLDLAHVDPLSKVVRISAGNPRYAAGRPVTLNAISGHRDVYPTSCPGASLYAQLGALRTQVADTGRPKLYSPVVTGALGGAVRFTARLSDAVSWTVTVRDEAGTAVGTGTGTGTKVDWTWDATSAPAGRYTWGITAPDMRAATGAIGNAPAPLALDRLRVSPGIVSPNGDGRGDQAKVSYRLSAAASVTAIVQDALGRTVATVFSGRRSAGTQELAWSPDALPDGWYRLALTAVAGAKQVQTSARFWVDRTLAATKATAKAFSPNGDGRQDTLGVSFRLVGPAHVEARVLQGRREVATLLTAELPAGAQRLTWDGNELPDGRYTIVVTSTDSLVSASQSVVVRIDRRAPTLRLLSLRRLLFRASEPGRLLIAVNGRWRRVSVRRAGLVHLRVAAPVRGLTATLLDDAGNVSRTIRARR